MIGYWTPHGGPWCLHAAFHQELDAKDAAYWESIGYLRMAQSLRERMAHRAKLMGWKE
jgi:hypothetical protein